ncbi:MAG: MFS transporter [Clostridia bacterium]|nr:MFS transporter [Clostridia bacterium]
MEKSLNQTNPTKKYSYLLIFLCWLAYSVSYLGKMSYSANIVQVEKFYDVTHASAGLVSTLLFISYGVMQIINGFLCKYYSSRFVIFLGLAVSGIVNLIVAFTDNFTLVTVLWFINGIALSFLWTAVIRTLSETLTKEYMAIASIIVGTTVAAGTFVIYGVSSVLVAINYFKGAFLFAGIVMPIVAVIWFIFMPRVVAKIPKEAKEELKLEKVNASKLEVKHIYLSVACFFLIAIAINFIKDGLVTWVPAIMKDTYNLPESISIILTLALPCVAVFGNMMGVAIHKKITDFVTQVALMFLISAVLVGAVIAGLSLNVFIITIVCFAVVYLCVSSCNSLVTSMFPLFMKGKVNSGLIAGVINGFCYVGSALSTYVLGAVADARGWNAVFWLLFIICVAVLVVWLVYQIVYQIFRKKHA